MPRAQFMNNILDDIFHPDLPICQITPTSTKKKVDQFCRYRPKSKTCLDYNISQTETKLDTGNVKIHCQQTQAEYVGLKDTPTAPFRKKRKFFSGGPPQWKFIDEIWKCNQLELQEDYHRQFKLRVAARKRNERIQMNRAHRKTIEQVGPTWYQELSPKQIKTVDNLKSCILKDLAEDIIINTQENIADLGLILRPNHKHIKIALDTCCRCPIEFLLILYQLIDPRRTKYSINDRLLLSAVVHLAMKETLKELHIRIPSPPPPPKINKKYTKRRKTVKHDSPYLKPFTFQKEIDKFTGIYTNKHIQRPQSPYFRYLTELKEMLNSATIQNNRKDSTKGSTRVSIKNKKSEQNNEMDEELKFAQEMYENLVEFRPVPTLLKASKYIPCINFLYGRQLQLNPIEEVDEEEEKEEEAEEVEEKEVCYTGVDQTRNAETKISEERLDICYCPSQTEDRLRGGAHNLPENEHQNYNFGSIPKNNDFTSTWTLIGTTSKTEPDSPRGSLYYQTKLQCKHTRDLEIYAKMHHLIRPSGGNDKPKCRCKEKYREFIGTPPCQCDKCKEQRHKQRINYVISGLRENDDEILPVVDRVVEEKPCSCLKKYNQMIKDYEQEKEEKEKSLCSCRKQTENLAQKPLCCCKKCEVDRRNKAAKHIIAGTKEITEEDSIRIIEGTSLGRPCDCLKKYVERVDKYETFKKSRNVVVDVKQKNEKYIIGGLSETSQGPQYVISGMRPPIDCACAKKARQEEAERRMEAKKPRPIAGRTQYGIVGVKETSKENIYILDKALPIEECDCMAVYHKFTEQHETCLELYEKYLAKVKKEYNEFMEGLLPSSSSRRSSRVSERRSVVEKEEKREDTEINEVEESITLSEEKEETKQEPKMYESSKLIANWQYPPSCCCGKPYYSKCCECGKIAKVECQQCTCGGEVIQCVDCTCGCSFDEEEKIERVVEKKETIVKRYFIHKKIKRNKKWQKNILKKALETMADDDFPLAKLPEVYKLPHFKLWMQMRCGKFWTQQDRYNYVLKSKFFWSHTNHCDIWKEKCPKVPVTREEASKLNWSQADFIRKLIAEPVEKFYKKIRQNRIHFGREFFPSTLTYEFPFKSWRDCYFAYTSTKEEDVLAKFVWKKYDVKNFADMKRFCK